MKDIRFNFSKEELLEVVGGKLAQLIHGDMAKKDAPATAEGRRRRAKNKTYTSADTVSEKQIADLIRSKGPLRVVEIMELTGLAQSAAHAKVSNMKVAGTVKVVKEGTVIRYDVTRGSATSRRVAKTPDAKDAAPAKPAKRPRGRPRKPTTVEPAT